MSDAAVQDLKSLLHDQPHNPLRPQQVKAYEDEQRRLTAIVNAPPHISADRGEAMRSLRKIADMLGRQRPRRIEEPERANRVHAGLKRVITDVIQPAMLPQTVMRRNPAGAVDAFMKGENSPRVKDAVLTVKRGLLALDPETDDIDHANLEKYRPSGLRPDGTATHMVDAQIAGVFGLTPLAKANTPFQEPTIDTPLKAAQRREAPAPKPKPHRTEAERKAWGEKMRAARAAKQQAREEAV